MTPSLSRVTWKDPVSRRSSTAIQVRFKGKMVEEEKGNGSGVRRSDPLATAEDGFKMAGTVHLTVEGGSAPASGICDPLWRREGSLSASSTRRAEHCGSGGSVTLNKSAKWAMELDPGAPLISLQAQSMRQQVAEQSPCLLEKLHRIYMR